MTKTFQKNQNNKIELTEEELTNLLQEAWNEGYNYGNYAVITIPKTYPYYPTITWDTPLNPYEITCSTTTDYIYKDNKYNG